MKKILLVGNCPLPEENVAVRPAAGLRTWQYLKVLKELASKGEIELTSVLIAMPECYKKEIAKGARVESEHYKEWVVSKDDPELKAFLREKAESINPEAIVAVNTFPSYVMAGACNAPLWCDLNGWIMAEGQAQAYKKGTNDYLPHYFEMEKAILLAGDKFSTVSRAQGHAVLGELAAVGRIGRESFGYNFIEHVPNGTEKFDGENGPSERQRARGDAITGLPEDAFCLLWMGGYNTWVDEHTLFKALEIAMQKCEKLYFVSTGGAIHGLEDKTFLRFKEMIDGSHHKERCLFLGWVPTEEIPYIYSRADAGINVDRKCLETLMGARNRINEMMKFALPVITTSGSEIAEEVDKNMAGIVVESGNYEKLARAIEQMYEEWRGGGERSSKKLKEYGENGERFIEERCNYKTTTAGLIAWLKTPQKAPDRGKIVTLNGGKLKMTLRYLSENGFKKFLIKVWQKIKK